MVDRVLVRESLTDREQAFWRLVDASHLHDTNERRILVEPAAEVLGPDDFYNALSVIALFNFYNNFVDVAGVVEHTAAGYEASGAYLAQHGYTPPQK